MVVRKKAAIYERVLASIAGILFGSCENRESQLV